GIKFRFIFFKFTGIPIYFFDHVPRRNIVIILVKKEFCFPVFNSLVFLFELGNEVGAILGLGRSKIMRSDCDIHNYYLLISAVLFPLNNLVSFIRFFSINNGFFLGSSCSSRAWSIAVVGLV